MLDVYAEEFVPSWLSYEVVQQPVAPPEKKNDPSKYDFAPMLGPGFWVTVLGVWCLWYSAWVTMLEVQCLGYNLLGTVCRVLCRVQCVESRVEGAGNSVQGSV